MTSAPPAVLATAAWSSAWISTISVSAGARLALPGRTRLATLQPASRNVSAAAWPSRPAAPSTRTRALMIVDRRDEKAFALIQRATDGTRRVRHFKCREFDRRRELKVGRWSRHVEGDRG